MSVFSAALGAGHAAHIVALSSRVVAGYALQDDGVRCYCHCVQEVTSTGASTPVLSDKRVRCWLCLGEAFIMQPFRTVAPLHVATVRQLASFLRCVGTSKDKPGSSADVLGPSCRTACSCEPD